MNIFVLDKDPHKAAEYLCNKHVVKMLLESAQILCTVSWKCDVRAPYKLIHVNHPVVIWAGQTLSNYNWLLEHALAIGYEYGYRFNKSHSSEKVLSWCAIHGGRPDTGGLTEFVQIMPDQYKCDDVVKAYRNYYKGEKRLFAKWTPSSRIPEWWLL